MDTEKLIIFDTTLRDGEQCPGASMNIKEKLEIARKLALLKVVSKIMSFSASMIPEFSFTI